MSVVSRDFKLYVSTCCFPSMCAQNVVSLLLQLSVRVFYGKRETVALPAHHDPQHHHGIGALINVSSLTYSFFFFLNFKHFPFHS